MRRRKFPQLYNMLGNCSQLVSCAQSGNTSASRFYGEVLIIGLGAAGMPAGFLLEQAGIKHRFLEAAGTSACAQIYGVKSLIMIIDLSRKPRGNGTQTLCLGWNPLL